MNPYASYKMNRDKEKAGVIIVENEHFRIWGARAGGKNVVYETRREALTKPHRRAIQTGTLPKDLQDHLNAQLAAEALVTKWETNAKAPEIGDKAEWVANTIHDPETGEVVLYTPELGTSTFVRYDELYDQFARGCADVENYLDKDEVEADAKN